jgi:CAAX prenyl protease-like protein
MPSSSQAQPQWWQTAFMTRVLPFILFLILTTCQGRFGLASHFWFYAVKTLIGIALIAWMWSRVKEMRWRMSWEACCVGLACFLIWVGLDGVIPRLGALLGDAAEEKPWQWNPFEFFTDHPALAWTFVGIRILGSALIVPPLEEVFYRSAVYRYWVAPNIESVPLNRFHFKAFCATSILFGVVHQEWLAGIFCGAAFQWLVLRKGHLGDAMTAHAITNALLGVYVVWTDSWQFW